MTRQPASLPAPLRAINEQVNRAPAVDTNLADLQPGWADYIRQAKAQVPGLQVEAGGENVYWGGLSPGCQACKAGTWDCIFITLRCNLACGFCYSPQALPEDYAGSALGATPEQIVANQARIGITGIGFSGGEPFLEPQKLLEWVGWFKSRRPDQYAWAYTNGLLAHEAPLRQLGQLGLDELRFNLAATGYTHPAVMKNLALAARCIPTITVEIPAIPEEAAKLLASLAAWCEAGVKFLNLHELIYEPDTRAASLAGRRQGVCLADGHRTAINPESRQVTLAVLRKAQAENLPLAINDCSLQSKLRQLRGRRRTLAPLTKAPYEKLVDEATLESYCHYRDAQEYGFCHPDEVDGWRADHPQDAWVRLLRLAPLALQGQSQWIACENC